MQILFNDSTSPNMYEYLKKKIIGLIDLPYQSRASGWRDKFGQVEHWDSVPSNTWPGIP